MNKREIKEQLKQAMENKEYDKIEELWIELIELDYDDLDFFYSIASLLATNDEKERASLLLILLSACFKEKGDFMQVLNILKKAAVFSPQNNTVRQELVNCYQMLLKDNPQKRELIDKSGIQGSIKLTEILPLFDNWLYFNIGQYFYRQEWGVGRIKESDVLHEKKIVVDFERKPCHSLSLDMALKILTKLEQDHFLVIKATNLNRLNKMAKDSHVELLITLLKSVKQAVTIKEIKEYLTGIIAEQEWTKWWDTVKSEIKKDVCIEVCSSIPKTYRWCQQQEIEDKMIAKFNYATGHEKMEIVKEAYKKELEVCNQFMQALIELGNQSRDKKPALAIEIFLFVNELGYKNRGFNYIIEEIIKGSNVEFPVLLPNIKNFKYQLQVLKMIKTAIPNDWKDIYLSLFFDLAGTRLAEAIINELYTSNANENVDTILTMLSKSYKKYPDKFLLICKKRFDDRWKFDALSKYELIITLLKLLELKELKYLKPKIKEILLQDKARVLKECFNQISKDDFSNLYDALLESKGLKESEKDDIKSLAKKIHPTIVKIEEKSREEEKGYSYIYTTKEALDAKRKELQHIFSVAIPDNSKEIAVARSYGDLRENFEYKIAKERQGLLFSKAERLKVELSQVHVIRDGDISTDTVTIGTRVTLLSNKPQDTSYTAMTKEYTILGPWDIDTDKGIISYLTPIAKRLLKKKVGDKVSIENDEYEIIGIANSIRS